MSKHRTNLWYYQWDRVFSVIQWSELLLTAQKKLKINKLHEEINLSPQNRHILPIKLQESVHYILIVHLFGMDGGVMGKDQEDILLKDKKKLQEMLDKHVILVVMWCHIYTHKPDPFQKWTLPSVHFTSLFFDLNLMPRPRWLFVSAHSTIAWTYSVTVRS